MSHERTLYEALIDCRYGRQFCSLNARLYQRMDFVFGFASLFGMSSAFAGMVANRPTLTIAFGSVFVVGSILERMIAPALKAYEFRQHAKRYADLDARSPGMSLPKIDGELRRLQADGPEGFESLALPALNRNYLSNGHEDMVVPLPWRSRIASILA